MSLADEIDGPGSKKTASPAGLPIQVRHVIYPQLIAVFLSVAFGQCERWGYAHILETGPVGAVFGLVALTLFAMAPAFPVMTAMALGRQTTGRVIDWLAVPLSIAMSVTQILAMMPLVQ